MSDNQKLRTRHINNTYIELDDRKFDELISDLETLRDKVPNEYFHTARISIEGDYDSSACDVRVTYQSPVTQQELNAEKVAQDRIEEYQRKQYEELKKKFG